MPNRPDIESVRQRMQTEYDRVIAQVSAEEVPGFHARTEIDDIIGKLYAVRSKYSIGTPEDHAHVLLEKIDECVEELVDIALDREQDGVTDDLAEFWVGGNRHVLKVSGSKRVRHCSCGAPTINLPPPMAER